MEARVTKLVTDLKIANDKIIELEKTPMTSTAKIDSPFSFSAMLKGVALLALVAKENRDKSRIENNIIINGIVESIGDDPLANDINKVNDVLNVLNLSRNDVKKQTRIKNKSNSNSEVQSKTQMILELKETV